jgi:oxygen-independent coproporphyrinogen III oxidase
VPVPLSHALLKHNQQVPRYTSYPTANHFSDGVSASDAEAWFSAADTGDALSLYFHIPFCKKICWYCGCHTKASKQYGPVDTYISYLKKEITLVAQKLGGKRTVSHIHFGGGSPSYMTAEDFSSVMGHVEDHFALLETAEIAIEVDPRELSELKVAAYRKAGVNRVSLGVQDFHSDVQKAINRLQPLRQIHDAVHLLRAYGIDHINMDLLYGLPLQTSDSICENVTMALGLDPSRISLFGYAHVPWMKKHMRLIDQDSLPNSTERLDQFTAAADALKARGYVQIGLDHFVKSDDPMAKALEGQTLKRNFQGYSTDTAPIMIGFGTSAISDLGNGYLQNTLSNHAYYKALDAGVLPTAKGLKIVKKDLVIRRLIEQLMCYMEIDLATFAANEGLEVKDFSAAFEKLVPLIEDGLIKRDGYKVSVNPKAPQAVRLVCAAFDPMLTISEKKHAQVA